jgi:DNA-binding CsgD family transcriptional regulator
VGPYREGEAGKERAVKGANLRVAKPYEPKEVLERIRTALGRVLRRFSADLHDPRFLRVFTSRGLVAIATVEEEDCAYALCRVPILLSKVLSEREIKVALLVGGSLSNKEIGRNLHLSAATISSHLGRINSKLGVHTRVDLALLTIGLPHDSSGDAAKT